MKIFTLFIVTFLLNFSAFYVLPASAEEETASEYYRRQMDSYKARREKRDRDDESSYSYNDPFKSDEPKEGDMFYVPPIHKDDRVLKQKKDKTLQLDTWGRGKKRMSSEQVLQHQLSPR